jgi:hypothetical protein
MSPNADIAFTVPAAVTSVTTTPDPTRDETLSADQLQEKYDPAAKDGAWGEHPMYRIEEWRDDVAGKKTLLGYWPWVVAQFQEKDDGARSKAEKHAEKRAAAEEKEVEQLEAEDPGNQGS